MFDKNYKGWPLIAASILAAAWLISGEDILQGFGVSEKLISVLVNTPATIVFIWIISGRARCAIKRNQAS